MRRHYRTSPWCVAITFVLTLHVPTLAADARLVWTRTTQPAHPAALHVVALDPIDTDGVYVATTRTVYRSPDAGRTWQRLLTLRGANAPIQFIVIHPQQTHTVYVGTARGVYVTHNRGTTWSPLTRGRLGRLASLSFLIDDRDTSQLWLGTTDGLWHSRDAGRAWTRDAGPLAHGPVWVLASDPVTPLRLYVVTNHHLWRTDDAGHHWQSLVLLRATAGDDSHAATETTPVVPTRATATLTIHAQPSHRIVLATHETVRVSHDAGRTWDTLSRQGLLLRSVEHLVTTHEPPSRLYAATDDGVFLWSETDQQWSIQRTHWSAQHLYDLALHPTDGSLWAVTDHGVLHSVWLSSTPEQRATPLTVWSMFSYEPSVLQVQSMAVRYAEASPLKITRWRRHAAMRAVLPTLRVGFDRDLDISDRVDEGPFPKFQQIPMRSTGHGWDVSVTWDLSELLWNDDQLSIDARAKLTTDLRNEILDDVTRLYFERRRLQAEQILRPLDDVQMAFERDLRVRELTAHIDAFTGGDFSRALEQPIDVGLP